MATIKTAIQLYDGMSKPMIKIANSMDQTISKFDQMDKDMRISGETMSEVKSKVTSYAHELKKLKNMDFGDAMKTAWSCVDRDTLKVIESQKKYNTELSKSSNLVEKLKGFAISVGAAFGVSKVVALADTMTSTTARLNLMNDGIQTTSELQNRIYQSSQRSRTSYQETAAAVSKLGILAKDAFSSNDEMIAFSELMNMQFKIGGASVQEQTSAMYQLTQAMAAGKLQGDEFRSIMENAPLLAQSIAQEMGKSVGELREMSSAGLITADVIKRAMFSSAEETNAKFKEIPMTFEQLKTVVGNGLIQTFQPLIQLIGSGAQFIYDNWSMIEPIFWGLTGAVGAYALIMAGQAAITWVAKAAQDGLNLSMLANPAMWIALAIGVLIGIIYKWIQSVGGISVAWMITKNVLLTGWSAIKIGFYTGVYFVIDLWEKLIFKTQSAGVAIQNFVGDMKVGTIMILQNMVNEAIGIINGFIDVLNKIPGVSIETISNVTFGSNAVLENEAEKQARKAGLESFREEIESNIADRDSKMLQMKVDAINASAERQAEINAAKAEVAAKQSNNTAGFDFDSMLSNIEDTAGNTAKMSDAMDASEEDLKYLRDLAEQEIINRFTTAEVKVEMGGVNNVVSSNVDLDGVVSYLGQKLTETLTTVAEGVPIGV